MEMRRNELLLMVTIAFILMYAYLPIYLIFDHGLHQPFYFCTVPNGGITWYHYADYLSYRIAILIPIYLLGQFIPKYREYLFIYLLLWIGYLIEFLLAFNQPFGYYHSIPISYSLGAGLSMIILTFHQWKKKL